MEGEEAQICVQRICPRRAGLVRPAGEGPRALGERSARPRPGRLASLAGTVRSCLSLDRSPRVLPAPFCPLTQPGEGLRAARNRAPHGGPVGKSLLWVNQLFARVSPRPGPVGDGPLRRPSRWGRRGVAPSCSENATANWNHVVRIKSRSSGFLSLISGALFIRPKGSSEIFIY